jgi:hypothetical protein
MLDKWTPHRLFWRFALIVFVAFSAAGWVRSYFVADWIRVTIGAGRAKLNVFDLSSNCGLLRVEQGVIRMPDDPTFRFPQDYSDSAWHSSDALGLSIQEKRSGISPFGISLRARSWRQPWAGSGKAVIVRQKTAYVAEWIPITVLLGFVAFTIIRGKPRTRAAVTEAKNAQERAHRGRAGPDRESGTCSIVSLEKQ